MDPKQDLKNEKLLPFDLIPLRPVLFSPQGIISVIVCLMK